MFKKVLVGIAMIALIAAPVAMANDTITGVAVGDLEGQGQGQGQGQAINTDSHDSNNVESPRYLPNPGVTPIPGTNGFFTAPTPDSSFRSIREIVQMDNPEAKCLRVSEGTLLGWARGADADINYQPIREVRVLARGNKADRKLLDGTTEEARWLNICIEMPEGFKTAAFVDGEADDGTTNMLGVLGKAAGKAIRDGVNTLVITAEGAHRAVEASGWGVGLYMLGSDVSSGGSTAGVMGGGTGYASNETQTEDEPWFQGKAGMVE